MSVCLSSRISKTTDLNFTKFSVHLCTLVAVARSSSDESAIGYVLPVLWIMSSIRIMEPMGQNCRQRYVSTSSLAGGNWVKFLSTTAGMLGMS